ncbi:MAG: protein kinase [Anaerolineae bacterium]|nr:protein kinase [Anaerolineae bacterium]
MDYKQLAGEQLGQYQLEELIHDASIVFVYRALQSNLRRKVAVQILKDIWTEKERYRQSFLQGAEIMAQLEHPNIVPIHDAGMQGHLTYAVTRLMPESLRNRLKQGVILPAEVAAILRQVGNALDYVHSLGMVHGDPSIGNIMFDHWGSAYLADFILAGFLTHSKGGINGTPWYMSPERWNEEKSTPASDQYALGAITYHMLTQQSPFTATNMVGLMQLHATASLPSLPQDIPNGVNEVLFRAMAKKAEDRYPTVMDFVREFEKAIADTPRHLFISYSRQDKGYAQQLSEHLQHNGFAVWIDSKIDYGDAWFDEIDDAVKTCAAFVLLMTPHAQQSEWVKKEILLAKRYKKPIFPVLLDGEEFPIVIDIQFADVRDGTMPAVDFHRRLRRAVFGDI